MSKPRRQLVCALHALAVAAALAANIAGAAWAQQPSTAATVAAEPATTPDQIALPKGLDSVTVSGSRENTSTRLQLTPRETPQSVSTVTREQIERQSLTSIDAVLRKFQITDFLGTSL